MSAVSSPCGLGGGDGWHFRLQPRLLFHSRLTETMFLGMPGSWRRDAGQMSKLPSLCTVTTDSKKWTQSPLVQRAEAQFIQWLRHYPQDKSVESNLRLLWSWLITRLWLVNKTRATFSASEKQNQNQSQVTCTQHIFPALEGSLLANYRAKLTLWLVNKTRATFSASEKQNQNQSQVACTQHIFPRLSEVCWPITERSSAKLKQTQFTFDIQLKTALQHSVEKHSIHQVVNYWLEHCDCRTIAK